MINHKLYRPTPFSEGNHPDEYEKLTAEEKRLLQVWIQQSIVPFQTKTYAQSSSSYGLKHRFSSSNVGFYITNGQFKGAMLAAGFKPKQTLSLNWHFKLGRKAGTVKEIDLLGA